MSLNTHDNIMNASITSLGGGIAYGTIKTCNNCRNGLKIKDVIFNPPATIIFWNDDTKTVVKSHENDIYSQTWGLMFCFAKKLLGSGHQVRKMLDKYAPEWGDEILQKESVEPITKELQNVKTITEEQSLCDIRQDMDDTNYMIFNDRETTKHLEKVLEEYTYVELLQAYHNLNNWKLPMNLARAINFPTYLYTMFDTLDIPVKEKTVTPLIRFVSCEIAKREHKVFLENGDCEASDLKIKYTWEKRNHIEY